MAKKSAVETVERKKTVCPISRADFAAKAKPVAVNINGQNFAAPVKSDNGENSLGWFLNDKVVVVIDGVPVRCQVGFNLTCIGSKPE